MLAIGRTLAVLIVLVVAVGLIYSDAARSYFFDDDFHWLADSRRFEWLNLLRLGRYGGFYRPVIEIYFYLGLSIFGCEAFPFHVASIAIHLLNTSLLFLFARTLTGSLAFAFLSALFFCVQPGYVEAVVWIGAITDLLPATWYLLALWMHLRWLQRGAPAFYAGATVAVILCFATHESSATLVPMMIALDAIVVTGGGGLRAGLVSVARRAKQYAPLVALLVAYLSFAYVINTRHYVVREGYYAFGWHAVPNVLDYIVSLYVGKRTIWSYLLIVAVSVAVLWRGTPRARFFVVWMFVTLVPVSFFTWGSASRYLYLAAAGFALLLAELTLALHREAMKRVSPRTAVAITAVLASALAIRFAIFANKGADAFRERTLPYERFTAAVRASGATPYGVVHLDHQLAEGVPELYRDPSAETALCAPDIHVIVSGR